MTQQELDALKALADAATPELQRGGHHVYRIDANGELQSHATFVDGTEDAAWYVAARAAVPALLAEVERLRAELALRDRYNGYARITQSLHMAEVLPFDEWNRGDVPPLRPDAPRLRRPTKD